MGDVFALQDKVAEKIVAALSVTLTADPSDASKAEETALPAAYDAFLKGWEHYRLDTPEHYAKALAFFQEATALDPGYDRARAAMASIHWKSYKQDWAAVLGLGAYESRSRALELLSQVADEPLALAQQVASQVALWRGRFDEAIEAAEAAVAENSSDADSQVVLAEALIYGGAPERALPLIASARRHDPSNEARYLFLQGLAAFVSEQFEAAARAFERTLELNPDLWNPDNRLGDAYCYPCVVLVSTYGYLGHSEEAHALSEKIKQQWPNFSVSTDYFLWPFRQGRDMDRFTKGLLKAGVAEQPGQ